MAEHQEGETWEMRADAMEVLGPLQGAQGRAHSPCAMPGTTRALRAGCLLLRRAWIEGAAGWDERWGGNGEGEEFTAPEHLLRVVTIRAADPRGALSACWPSAASSCWILPTPQGGRHSLNPQFTGWKLRPREVKKLVQSYTAGTQPGSPSSSHLCPQEPKYIFI